MMTYEERVKKALQGSYQYDPCFVSYLAEYATPDKKIRFSVSLRGKDRKMANRLANAEKYAPDNPPKVELLGVYKIRRR